VQKTVSLIAMAAAVCFVGCSKEKESKPAMTPASGTQTQSGEREWTEGSSSAPQDDPHTGMPEPPTQQGATEEGTMGQGSMEQGSMEQGSMEEGSMGDQPMGAQPSGSPQEHAAMLAATRCRREFRCDQIGSDKKYPSMEMCQATLLADANKELGKCPKGMNRKKVQECAAAIDTKGCDMPGDHLTEYEECRTVSLCL
jgi:hypothetical protein